MKQCDNCDGTGIVIEIASRQVCCGYGSDNGECCGMPTWEHFQVQEQCAKCKATGIIED